MTFDPNKVYGDVPQSFSHRVEYALRHCEKEEAKPMKRKPIVAIIITVLMLALTTTAVAAVLSRTTEFFIDFYGESLREELENGVYVPGGQTTMLDNVTFTLFDAVITDHTTVFGMSEDSEVPYRTLDSLAFWATGAVSVADENSNIFLLPWDDLTLPEDPESKDLKLISVIPNGLLDDQGEIISADCGFTLSQREDNTLHFSVELPPKSIIPERESYQLSLYIAIQDADAQGNPIEGTRQSTDWIITLTPEVSE